MPDEIRIGDKVSLARPTYAPVRLDTVGTVVDYEAWKPAPYGVSFTESPNALDVWHFRADQLELVEKAPQEAAEANTELELSYTGGFVTKDSGERQEWDTGSRRDSREGKGRFDLLPVDAVRRLAQLMERGAVKYGDRNWELGQPLSRFLDSALRHTFQVVEGDESEDHAIAAAWNLFAFVHTQARIRAGELPAELDDLPRKAEGN